MQQVNLHEAKTHLSRLVEAAAKGQEIVIAIAGKPMARLVPLRPSVRKQRKPGALKGKIWIADDFDAPMTAEEQSVCGPKTRFCPQKNQSEPVARFRETRSWG